MRTLGPSQVFTVIVWAIGWLVILTNLPPVLYNLYWFPKWALQAIRIGKMPHEELQDTVAKFMKKIFHADMIRDIPVTVNGRQELIDGVCVTRHGAFVVWNSDPPLEPGKSDHYKGNLDGKWAECTQAYDKTDKVRTLAGETPVQINRARMNALRENPLVTVNGEPIPENEISSLVVLRRSFEFVCDPPTGKKEDELPPIRSDSDTPAACNFKDTMAICMAGTDPETGFRFIKKLLRKYKAFDKKDRDGLNKAILSLKGNTI